MSYNYKVDPDTRRIIREKPDGTSDYIEVSSLKPVAETLYGKNVHRVLSTNMKPINNFTVLERRPAKYIVENRGGPLFLPWHVLILASDGLNSSFYGFLATGKYPEANEYYPMPFEGVNQETGEYEAELGPKKLLNNFNYLFRCFSSLLGNASSFGQVDGFESEFDAYTKFDPEGLKRFTLDDLLSLRSKCESSPRRTMHLMFSYLEKEQGVSVVSTQR